MQQNSEHTDAHHTLPEVKPFTRYGDLMYSPFSPLSEVIAESFPGILYFMQTEL